ncbi:MULTISPECIES: RodZ domain-containing protein [Arhodomonas]|uniref:RodZ domain-containing protein n=2 Tax=Ectothiorhodospiraceae TaxID=72276 RepID=UPI0003A1D8EA|nr:RodZ domain-containing protein [Arhodomonas aquaeolei]
MASFDSPVAEAPEETGGHGPGRRLRLARERRELAVGAVADALHLHRHVVVAIEEDRYDDLPPVTFTRGYIRSYARFLELPETEILEAFDRLGVRDASPTFTPPGSESGPRRGAGLPAGTPWLLVVLVVAVLAVAGWFWFNDDGFGALIGRDQPEVGASAPAASGTVEQQGANATEGSGGAASGVEGDAVTGTGSSAASAPPEDAGVAASGEQTGITGAGDTGTGGAGSTGTAPEVGDSAAAGAPESGTESPAAADTGTSSGTARGASAADAASGVAMTGADAAVGNGAAGTTAAAAGEEDGGDGAGPAPAGSDRLTFEFTGESWMEVTDAAGDRLLFGLVGGGETRTVTGEPPFEIVVGDVSVVSLSHDGQAVPLADRANGRVARFTLGESR